MALNITKIKPMFTKIITTMNKYDDDVKIGSLIDSNKVKGTIKEYQTIVAVGTAVTNIKVGDQVMINPARYAKVNHKHPKGGLAETMVDMPTVTYSFDVVKVNGEDCLVLDSADVLYVFEGEEIPDEPKESSKLILPEKPKIIV